MSGLLDGSRFEYYLAQAIGCPVRINAMVIGAHGDLMVPLLVLHLIKADLLLNSSEEKLAEIEHATQVGGGTLTSLLGTSAWYAPGTTAATMAEAIAKDSGLTISSICYLMANMANMTFALVFLLFLVKAVSKKLLFLTSTKKNKLCSTQVLAPHVKQMLN